MIHLAVSEAYSLDYYAILMVKESHKIPGTKAEMERWQKSFNCQSWKVPLYQVEESDEFKELLLANHQVWDLVGKAGKNQCLASEVDAANQRRYAAKKALQKRFWPNEPLTEKKSKRPNESNS